MSVNFSLKITDKFLKVETPVCIYSVDVVLMWWLLYYIIRRRLFVIN